MHNNRSIPQQSCITNNRSKFWACSIVPAVMLFVEMSYYIKSYYWYCAPFVCTFLQRKIPKVAAATSTIPMTALTAMMIPTNKELRAVTKGHFS